MRKYFCDICNVEIGEGQALGGQYFKARIAGPMEVLIDITAYRPLVGDSASNPPLEICMRCVFDAIAELDKRITRKAS